MRISVVTCGRNDGYEGNWLERFERFLASIPRDFELVMVEYNPPPDRPLLQDLYRDRATFYQVPAEFHNTLPNSNIMPIHDSTAKNIGIRRALGQYIVTTNVGVMFSHDLNLYLRYGEISRGAVYTAKRHDLDEQEKTTTIHDWAPGDLTLMHRDNWWLLRGYAEGYTFGHWDSYTVERAQAMGLEKILLPHAVYHLHHTRAQHAVRPWTPMPDPGNLNTDQWGSPWLK